MIGDVGDRPRQGEDDMEIGHRQQLGSAVGEPLLGSGSLAFWAMPIAAEAMRVTGEGMRWRNRRCMKPMDVTHEPS